MAEEGPPEESILHHFLKCVNFGIDWSANQVRFPCPPRKKNTQPPPEAGKAEEVEPKSDADRKCPPSSCPKESPYVHPDQICPHRNEPPCCIIKMQNPCTPCCCEEIEGKSSCPPKCYPRKPREPTCGCDHCKKQNSNGKCCGEHEFFKGMDRESNRLHKA